MTESQENNGSAEELASLVGDMRRHLEWLEDAGVRLLPGSSEAPTSAFTPPRSSAPPPRAAVPARPAFLGGDKASAPVQPAAPPARPPQPASTVAPPAVQPRPTPSVSAPPSVPMPVVASAPPAPGPVAGAPSPDDRIRLIRQELGACTRCKLCETRNTIVYGQGNPRGELLFVGEGPGEDEDLSGVPFVGRAGQLLTKMIEAMGLTRDDVYICNIVKCRPPGNRRPEPEEVAACRPFVEEQIRAVKPKVIVALGATAAQALLRTEAGISSMRHRWHKWEGIDVMPTFHPSYLLRSPENKRPAWDDLKLVVERLGRSLPAKR